MALKIAEEEYETQFFGFAPSEFHETVQANIARVLGHNQTNFEIHPSRISPSWQKGIYCGLSIIRQKSKEVFVTIFFIYVFQKHILGVIMKLPDSFLLPSDADHETKATQQDINILNTEIEGLRMQLKNEKFMQGKLKAELKEIDKVTAEQENMSSGTVGSDAMIEIDDAKEKLVFLGSNVRKLVWAVKKVEQVTEKIQQSDQICQPQLSDILFEKSFK
ncbi:unnamed protein product, partial [Meganyctiphanes norvegica]